MIYMLHSQNMEPTVVGESPYEVVERAVNTVAKLMEINELEAAKELLLTHRMLKFNTMEEALEFLEGDTPPIIIG